MNPLITIPHDIAAIIAKDKLNHKSKLQSINNVFIQPVSLNCHHTLPNKNHSHSTTTKSTSRSKFQSKTSVLVSNVTKKLHKK